MPLWHVFVVFCIVFCGSKIKSWIQSINFICNFFYSFNCPAPWAFNLDHSLYYFHFYFELFNNFYTCTKMTAPNCHLYLRYEPRISRRRLRKKKKLKSAVVNNKFIIITESPEILINIDEKFITKRTARSNFDWWEVRRRTLKL